MKLIGLTGGIGAGKTTVLKALGRVARVRILIADEIAHDLMEPGTPCYQKLREVFAQDAVFREDLSFDRSALAAVLFSDEKKRKKLNGIVHPAVKQYIIGEAKKERLLDRYDYVIVEAALLIEEHYDEICDELWYVYASQETRKKRLMRDRGYSEEKAESIFAAQLSDESYRAHCAHVIDNDGDIEHVYKQLESLMTEEK